LKGGVNDWDNDPPVTVPAVVDVPVAGLNHSTFKVFFVAERFTLNDPPEGL
jgi:hypothetical protein